MSADAETAPYFSFGLDNARGIAIPVRARTEGTSEAIFSYAFLDGDRITSLSCPAEIEKKTGLPTTLMKTLFHCIDETAF